MNSCWLTLVHTLALLRTWPCTLSYVIYSYAHTHTHTHTHIHTHTLMYSVLAHTSYTCGKQYTCLMILQTLLLTNIVTCTCILFNSTDCISICVPSMHNTHMHTHRRTQAHTHTHMKYTHRHTTMHTLLCLWGKKNSSAL